MHAPAPHSQQATFVSEDADPRTSALWIRRGERLGDALVTLPALVSGFLSLFRKSAPDGARRAVAR